jgi:putative transposase
MVGADAPPMLLRESLVSQRFLDRRAHIHASEDIVAAREKAVRVCIWPEALWGTPVSPSTAPSTGSDLNKKICATIESWRNRPIGGEHLHWYRNIFTHAR